MPFALRTAKSDLSTKNRRSRALCSRSHSKRSHIGRLRLNDVFQLRMPKLKRVCFLFLVEMQVVNPVQARSCMRHKQLADNVIDGKGGKPCAAGPAYIVSYKVDERHPLRFKL